MSKIKKIKSTVRLQVAAGKATPAPPVGSALGPHGINIVGFCKEFNDQTKSMEPGMPVPLLITIYDDKSFSFIAKSTPASYLLRKAAGIEKGAQLPGKSVVGSVTKHQLREIAKAKQKDLSSYDEEAAIKILAGSAGSMGIRVVD